MMENKVAELPVHLLTPRGSSLEKGYKPRMFIICNLKDLLLGSLSSGGIKVWGHLLSFKGLPCCNDLLNGAFISRPVVCLHFLG